MINSQSYMPQSKSVEWSTPQVLFDKYHDIYKYSLDVCATKENTKCSRYYTIDDDGLSKPWAGNCWCNPPYGRGINKWVEKAVCSDCFITMLLPARTCTRWFHNYIYCKPDVEIEFLKGRLKYGDSKTAAPFPSMIVNIGVSHANK